MSTQCVRAPAASAAAEQPIDEPGGDAVRRGAEERGIAALRRISDSMSLEARRI